VALTAQGGSVNDSRARGELPRARFRTLVDAASTSLDFVLWHKVEQHEDLGPWPVFVTMQ